MSSSWSTSSADSRHCVSGCVSSLAPRRNENISASTVALGAVRSALSSCHARSIEMSSAISRGPSSVSFQSKCNFVPEVARGRLVARWRLILLRLDAQREELAAALRGADRAADPILGALNVERAAVVALLVVVRVLVVVAEQGAPVRIVVFHFRFSSAQDGRLLEARGGGFHDARPRSSPHASRMASARSTPSAMQVK